MNSIWRIERGRSWLSLALVREQAKELHESVLFCESTGLGIVSGNPVATRMKAASNDDAGLEENMNALEAIFSRRSIRQYTSKPVPHDMVVDIVRAGMHAPTAGNERPWHFIVLTDRALLDEIPKFHPYAAMLKHATAAVLVCADLALEKHKGCWVLDCAAATQTMLLAAHAKGLGAVWCGVYPTEDRVENLRKLLKLPDPIVPFSLVPLGFPAEDKKPMERFDASRIHDNRW